MRAPSLHKTAAPPHLAENIPGGPKAGGSAPSALALWAALLVGAWAFMTWGAPIAPWAFEVPRSWRPGVEEWLGAAVKWLQNDATLGPFTFRDFTRFLAAFVDAPYRLAVAALSDGVTLGAVTLPPLSWLALTGLLALAGLWARGVGLALLIFAVMLAVVVFGQWTSAMVTLASILIAVPLGVAGGLVLGLAAYRWPLFARALQPVLDLMQTIPVFAYLVPILILFGFGPTAAIIATLIYAMPPMARITLLALGRVPDELRDLGHMVGCSPRQMTWRVMVPAAREGLMVGVNQVIMLSLNMVIIASMIGAGGLGFDVLAALRRLDFGAGLEAGLAIVALAVVLDRLSQAVARRASDVPDPDAMRGGWTQRHPYLLAALILVVVTSLLGLVWPAVQTWPEGARLSSGTFWSDLVAYINIHYFDLLEGIKNTLLIHLMIPVKRFMVDLPWVAVALLLGVLGTRLRDWRLGLLAGGLTTLIAFTGLWEEAMITVYLCGIAVLLALLIGLPIGVLAAERARLWPPVRAVIDTLQTLPSFVYLMPAVMLFRVGDFTALIAVVAYAIAPAIRYTVLGLHSVDPALIEAARAMGCTRMQILGRVKLRLAAPEILLGLNQTIMFALSMLVITALVGTRDLGQQVYIALTKADAGAGLVAGLCVAFIAIIADRLISATADGMRARLGLIPGPSS